MRQHEQPIPLLECEAENENDIANAENDLELNTLESTTAVDRGQDSTLDSFAQLFDETNDENNVAIANEPVESDEEVSQFDTTVDNFYSSEEHNQNVDEQASVNTNNNSECADGVESSAASNSVDLKHALQTVHMDVRDVTAINTVLESQSTTKSQENATTESQENDQIKQIELAANEKAEIKNGKVVITKTIDDDVQMTFIHGQSLIARQPLYNIKMNDAISDNIPFKENVRKINLADMYIIW